jgi:ABC-2 type transport system ATP-binding protein
MRQRLGLAACLLRRPEVVLLDEPTSGLDPTGAQDARRIVTMLVAGGTTVLLSSHDLAEVADLCSSVTVLREGRVAFDGTLAQAHAQAPSPLHRLRTSDDRAAALAGRRLRVEVAETADGLRVAGGTDALDAYVLALGAEGIAVRSLELVTSPLAALYAGLVG